MGKINKKMMLQKAFCLYLHPYAANSNCINFRKKIMECNVHLISIFLLDILKRDSTLMSMEFLNSDVPDIKSAWFGM